MRIREIDQSLVRNSLPYDITRFKKYPFSHILLNQHIPIFLGVFHSSLLFFDLPALNGKTT